MASSPDCLTSKEIVTEMTESFVLWLTLSEDQLKQIIAFNSLEDKKCSYGTKSLRENPFA